MTTRLLVLGGTRFLGRHVVEAALARGHLVATYTRGLSGPPPDGARALHGDRGDAGALAVAVGEFGPDVVVDTSCQSRAAADAAARVLAGVAAYALVSSLNAHRGWPPGPVPDESAPLWPEDAGDRDGYGPVKAHAERVLTASVRGSVLSARVGLIAGPGDPVHRLGWWLERIAAGGRVVVPERLDQPIALVDARDLAGWLVTAVEQRLSGPVTATGPLGMTTLGGLLEVCREVTGSAATWVPVPDEELLAAGVQEWVHLPLWLAGEQARTAWDVGTARARQLGLPSRPVAGTVADTWAWQRTHPRPVPPPGRELPGLPPELEAALLSARPG